MDESPEFHHTGGWNRAPPDRRAVFAVTIGAFDAQAPTGYVPTPQAVTISGLVDTPLLRLMKAADLQGRHPKQWKVTTGPGENPAPVPDLVGQVFTAPAPNIAWCGDITFIKTWDGRAYLATVIDLHSRALVGWALDCHMRTTLVTNARPTPADPRRRTAATPTATTSSTSAPPPRPSKRCTDTDPFASVSRTDISLALTVTRVSLRRRRSAPRRVFPAEPTRTGAHRRRESPSAVSVQPSFDVRLR